jgi:putative hydrolase of the HAD superfamily
MSRIAMVGFDADDTLWHSETYFKEAHAEFERILGGYVDLADAAVHDRLLATERENIKLFGYGAKGMALSMIETSIALTQSRISAVDIHRLINLGKSILQHKVELLPGVREAVQAVAAMHRVVLITKGDLFHQERKVADSGMADLFHRIEIVSEKDERSYARLFEEFGVEAAQFVMVGNSLKSDIAPVLALGGHGIHVPYPLVWALDRADIDPNHPRFASVDKAADVPATLSRWD